MTPQRRKIELLWAGLTGAAVVIALIIRLTTAPLPGPGGMSVQDLAFGLIAYLAIIVRVAMAVLDHRARRARLSTAVGDDMLSVTEPGFLGRHKVGMVDTAATASYSAGTERLLLGELGPVLQRTGAGQREVSEYISEDAAAAWLREHVHPTGQLDDRRDRN